MYEKTKQDQSGVRGYAYEAQTIIQKGAEVYCQLGVDNHHIQTGVVSRTKNQTKRVIMYTTLFSILFLLVGILFGIIGNERFREYVAWNTHEFDKLFKENPHPEIYDKKGKLIKEDYLALNFELGYDPDSDWDGEEIYAEDDYE